VACGQGDGASAQLTHFVAVGGSAAATALASFGPMAVGSPTVKTVAVKIDETGTFAPAAQSRNGLYFGHWGKSAASEGAFPPRRAVRSGETCIGLPVTSSAPFVTNTVYVCPGASGIP
jgi:hypothetical protein